jgi:hypothetical protein
MSTLKGSRMKSWKLGLILPAFLASSCILTGDSDESRATIQAFFMHSSPFYVLLTVSNQKTECYTSSLGKTSHANPEIIEIYLDSSLHHLEDIEPGTQNGIYANTSANGINVEDRANLTISSVSKTRVKGTFQLTDTAGVPFEETRSFDALKCPDYNFGI